MYSLKCKIVSAKSYSSLSLNLAPILVGQWEQGESEFDHVNQFIPDFPDARPFPFFWIFLSFRLSYSVHFCRLVAKCNLPGQLQEKSKVKKVN